MFILIYFFHLIFIRAISLRIINKEGTLYFFQDHNKTLYALGNADPTQIFEIDSNFGFKIILDIKEKLQWNNFTFLTDKHELILFCFNSIIEVGLKSKEKRIIFKTQDRIIFLQHRGFFEEENILFFTQDANSFLSIWKMNLLSKVIVKVASNFSKRTDVFAPFYNEAKNVIFPNENEPKEKYLIQKKDDDYVFIKDEVVQVNEEKNRDSDFFFDCNSIYRFDKNENQNKLVFEWENEIKSLQKYDNTIYFSDKKAAYSIKIHDLLIPFQLKYENSTNLTKVKAKNNLIVGLTQTQEVSIWHQNNSKLFKTLDLPQNQHPLDFFILKNYLLIETNNSNLILYHLDNLTMSYIFNKKFESKIIKIENVEKTDLIFILTSDNKIFLMNILNFLTIWSDNHLENIIDIAVSVPGRSSFTFTMIFAKKVLVLSFSLDFLSEINLELIQSLSEYGEVHKLFRVFEEFFLVSFTNGNLVGFYVDFKKKEDERFKIIKKAKFDYRIDKLVFSGNLFEEYIAHNEEERKLFFFNKNGKIEYSFFTEKYFELISDDYETSFILVNDKNQIGQIIKNFECDYFEEKINCGCSNGFYLKENKCERRDISNSNNKFETPSPWPYIFLIIFALSSFMGWAIYNIKSTERALIKALEENQ